MLGRVGAEIAPGNNILTAVNQIETNVRSTATPAGCQRFSRAEDHNSPAPGCRAVEPFSRIGWREVGACRDP